MQYIEHQERYLMTLECLPNEILLDLFEYFNGIDLLHAFYDLNHRLNYLLYNKFLFYCFDLNLTSKQKFDIICQQYFPFITNRIINLRFREIGQIPQQINYFFSYISSLSQFPNLRSLSIPYINSANILLKIFDECQYLKNLIHLDIHFCSYENHHNDFELHLNQIWTLPNLTHLSLFISMRPGKIFPPTKLCSTLTFLKLSYPGLPWNQLNQLFECTPHLKHLFLYIKSIDNYDLIPTPPSTLTKLTICFSSFYDTSKIFLFLQKLSNLYYLNITLLSNLINGNQWEELIYYYLLKLKEFYLKMTYEFYDNLNLEDQGEQLINTFRNSFWIEKYKWFVRYHIFKNELHLFTLNNAFYYYDTNFPEKWKSTDTNDNQQKFYNHITSIYNETFFNQSFIFDIQLLNINYLCIKFPINEQFWSIVISLKQLYSLTISSYNDTFQSQLQIIIDQASELKYLTIYQDKLSMSLFKLTNLFIHNLTFKKYQFNEEECMTLTYSNLAKNCQYLSIHVKNPQCILILVKNMINLQILYVKCENEIVSQINDVDDDNKNASNKSDELIQWLKNHLPSTCLISKNPENINALQIWI